MGAYRYIKESFQKEYKARDSEFRARFVAWRREPAVMRIDKPTNIARARELGYRDKQGVIVARVKIIRGLSHRLKPQGGRKPSKNGRFYAYRKSLQAMAEERVSSRFTNCEVLNSYYVGEDGEYRFFEAILLDRSNPSIIADSTYRNVIEQRGRAYRGLTAVGRKHRGIIEKGFGTQRNRPSVRSQNRKILR